MGPLWSRLLIPSPPHPSLSPPSSLCSSHDPTHTYPTVHLPKLIPLPEMNVLPLFFGCKTLTHPARPSSKGPLAGRFPRLNQLLEVSSSGLLSISGRCTCLCTCHSVYVPGFAQLGPIESTGTGPNPSLVRGAGLPRGDSHMGRLRCHVCSKMLTILVQGCVAPLSPSHLYFMVLAQDQAQILQKNIDP